MKRQTDMTKLGAENLAWLKEHGIPEGRYAQPPGDKWAYWRFALLCLKGRDPKEAFDEVWGEEEFFDD